MYTRNSTRIQLPKYLNSLTNRTVSDINALTREENKIQFSDDHQRYRLHTAFESFFINGL